MEVDQGQQQHGSHELISTSIVNLLHRGDQLTQAFQRHYAESLNRVEALLAAHVQHANLLKLASRLFSPLYSNPQSQLIRDRTLSRLAQTGEEALQGIRDCLGNMEEAVDGLTELLYQVDLFLAQPQTALQWGLNPQQALTHLSGLQGSYQAELVAKRELFADMNAEEIELDKFVLEWKVCKEIQGQQNETMDDLAGALGGWTA